MTDNHRWPPASAAIAVLMLAAAASAGAADNAQDILQDARTTYAALASYSDTGTVTEEYGAAASTRHTFSTRLRRTPRGFLFDFHKDGGDRIVVWGDPDAFHAWWKSTGVQNDYPNPNNTGAITLNEFPTLGAVTKISSLFYARAALPSAISNLSVEDAVTTEDVSGRHCHRLSGVAKDFYGKTGKSVNTRSVTVWIDAQTHLVRQVREEMPAPAGAVNRITTTFEPQADPVLSADSLSFVAPGSK